MMQGEHIRGYLSERWRMGGGGGGVYRRICATLTPVKRSGTVSSTGGSIVGYYLFSANGNGEESTNQLNVYRPVACAK